MLFLFQQKEQLQVSPSKAEDTNLEVNNFTSEKFQPQVVLQRLPESTINRYLSCSQDFAALGSHRRKRTISYFRNSLCQLRGKSKCLYCCTSQTKIKCGKKSAHKRPAILKHFSQRTVSVASHQKKSKLFKTVLNNSLSGMISKHKFLRKRKLSTEVNAVTMKTNSVNKPELQTNGRITTLHPELFRDLNEILSTVEDAVIAETKLLTTVENALLAKSKHSLPNYLQDHELKRNDNSGMDIISPDCIKKEPEECDFSVSSSLYVESAIESPVDFYECTDEVSTGTQNFQQDSDSNSCIISEKSSNPNSEIWPTPRIVSVSSIASQEIQEPIFDEKIYGYVKDAALKMTELSENHSNLQIQTSINCSSTELEQSNVMCNMQNSLTKLENVLAVVLQLKQDGTNCKHKDKAHEYEKNNNLFDKFSLIIKDSREGSEHFNVNAKHILELVSNYS